MKKLILTFMIVMLASACLHSKEQIITDTTFLEIYKSENVKYRHDIKQIDKITFQKLTGSPKCEITVEPLSMNSASVGETLFVTAKYNKEMNKEFDPIITFLTATTSFKPTQEDEMGWIDNFTFIAAYELLDKDQQFILPKISVKGARDLNANLQDSAVLSDAFIVDTRDPEVAKVDFPSYLNICDDDAGEKYSIKFTFTEKMRTKIMPTVSVFPPACTSNTFTNYTGKWTKNNEFTATYTIVDGNMDYDSVAFTISNAQDSSGNKISMTPAGQQVSVDTRNPTVSGFTATKTNFNLNDVNSVVKFTVSFSEPIEGAPAPILSFTPDIKGMGILVPEPGQTGPDPNFKNRYIYAFTVKKPLDVNYINVDVTVKEAKDTLCGNMSVEYTKQDFINVLFLITKVIEENFDSYITGGPPTTPPWERLTPEGVSNKVQSTWRYSLENSLELEGTQTAPIKNERALQQFSATPDEINFEIFVMADALTDSGGVALVTKSTMANWASMTYCTDGKVKIQSGSSAPVTVDFSGADNPYAATVWALIRLQYNKVSGDLKFYVNNSLITTTTGTVPSGTFDSILLFSNKGKMYFDDILLWHQ